VWLTVCVRITTEKARKLAAELELDVHAIGICHACLCVVSFAIDGGDEADIRRQTNAFAGPLWHEGLALPARVALERARRTGVPLAEEAIADVEQRGARSPVVRAIVRRLGEDLLADMRLPRRAPVLPMRPANGRGGA
jgi:hypothetical protein